jgi:hypothetical protein
MGHSLPKAGYFLNAKKLIDVTVLFCYSYETMNPSTFGRKRATHSREDYLASGLSFICGIQSVNVQ